MRPSLIAFFVCLLCNPILACQAQTASKSFVKVAAAQLLTDTDDIGRNQRKIMDAIRQAESQNCDVVLFHEGCLTGYPNREQVGKLDFELVRQAELEIRNLAKELEIAVLLGSTGNQDQQYLNYVLVIDEHGRLLGHYDKTWRAGEPHYCAGQGPVIFTVAGVEATVIICHDLRYPELVRLSVAAGARIVFIANNESGITSEQKLLGYRSMQIARATENFVYAVMSNSPADPQDITRHNCSHGNSKIVDPLGNVIDEAGMFEERLVIAELKLSEATASVVTRTLGQNQKMQELYGVACENEAYAAWIRAGLALVRRLDGSNLPPHFRDAELRP